MASGVGEGLAFAANFQNVSELWPVEWIKVGKLTDAQDFFETIINLLIWPMPRIFKSSNFNLDILIMYPPLWSERSETRHVDATLGKKLVTEGASHELCDGASFDDQRAGLELVFKSCKVRAGDYHFKIGTAGSTTLLAQTLLPVLWSAEGESTLILEGGTHNPLAPSMDFITHVYLPALRRMGLEIEGALEKYGFAPAGGGRISFKVAGGQTPRALDFLEKGKETGRDIICLLANVPEAVGKRENETLFSNIDWAGATVDIISPEKVEGSGNTLSAAISYKNVTELITTHGSFAKPAENGGVVVCVSSVSFEIFPCPPHAD